MNLGESQVLKSWSLHHQIVSKSGSVAAAQRHDSSPLHLSRQGTNIPTHRTLMLVQAVTNKEHQLGEERFYEAFNDQVNHKYI